MVRMVEESRTHKVCLLLDMRTYHCHLSQNEGHLQMGRGGYINLHMHLNIHIIKLIKLAGKWNHG